MRHAQVEQWSRGASPLHRRDPGAKLLPLGIFLVALATTHRGLTLMACGSLVLLSVAILAARLPLLRVLQRGAVVVPFSGTFAVISWLSGDSARATELLLKSYLSAIAVLLVVATSPLPGLLRRVESAGVPPFLLSVVQFIYRYIFVMAEEAGNMRTAAAARGGLTFRAAAGSLAVLFARSHQRAVAIQQAMLARGFAGRFIPLSLPRFGAADAWFAAIAGAAVILLRVASERFA